MKKNVYTLVLGVCFSFAGMHAVAQNQSEVQNGTIEVSNEVSPLKPADGSPYIFSSKEDLEKAQSKKAVILERIKTTTDERSIISLREDLWRIENGMVQTNKTK